MAQAAHEVVQQAIDRIALIRAEYLEMPGLSPTIAQAQRLWNLDPTTLREVFAALVDAHFLRQTASGAYVLADAR